MKIAILILIALQIASNSILGAQELKSWTITYTGSMLPLYRGGEVVATAKLPWDQVKVGHIVVMRTPKGHVIHELVIKKPDGSFVMKGINNPFNDPWVLTADRYEGSVVIYDISSDSFKPFTRK